MCSPASSAWGHADFYPSLPISASCHPSEYQDFFLEVENFQHCSAVMARQSEWVLQPLGYCGRASGHFLRWLNFEGWWLYLQHAWSFFHQVCDKGTHRAGGRRGAACIRAVQGQGVLCHRDAVPCKPCLASWHVQGMDVLEWNLLSLSCLQG